eukprot:GILK01005785.1.p1 GENE.GILK01005785.1~~GILK01005785.1.p1  ORF type:complete len:333 (+),score=23.96 GILK01005785.1:38-1036(+)
MRGFTLLVFLVFHVLPALLYEIDTDASRHDIAFPSSTSFLQLSSYKSHLKARRSKTSGRLRHKTAASVRKHKESSKKPLWGKAKKHSKLQRRLRHPHSNKKKTSHPQLSMAPSFAEQSSSFVQPVNSYPAPAAASPPASESSLAREYADALFRQTATVQTWQPNSYAAYASPFSHAQQQPFPQVPSSFFPPAMPSMPSMSPSAFMQPPPSWMPQPNLPLQIPLPNMPNNPYNMPYASNDTIPQPPSATIANNIDPVLNMNTMLRLAEQQQGQGEAQVEGQGGQVEAVGEYEHLLDKYRVTSLHLPPSMPPQDTLPNVAGQRALRSMPDNNKR